MSAAREPDAELVAVAAVRQQLWDKGWRPVPIHSWNHILKEKAGKAPFGKAWGAIAAQDPPGCLSHRPDPQALNTGVVSAGLRVIDIDIDDPARAKAVSVLVIEQFGPTIVRTRENSPRCLLVYRAAEGEPRKRTLKGDGCKVEVLGKGQQFVAYGKHPSGAGLEWRNGGPLDTSLEQVTAITEVRLDAFLTAAAKLIGAPPRTPAQPLPSDANGHASAEPPAALARVLDEIADLPSDNYDDWIKVGCGLHSMTSGSAAGLAAWNEWSARSDKYPGADAIAAKWATFGNYDGTKVTSATIIMMARTARMRGASHEEQPGSAPPPPRLPRPSEDEPEDEPDEGEAEAELEAESEPKGEGEAHPEAEAENEPDGETEGEAESEAEAENTTPEADDDDRPPIFIAGGELHVLANQAEEAIIASRLPVYQRGILVRPASTELDAADGGKTHITALHPLGVPDLLDLFCRTAAWKRWSHTRHQYEPADPPENVARVLLAREGHWRVPQLRGILSTPTLRRDGSLLDKAGYDQRSRYYLALPQSLHVPSISDEPDRSEAVVALALLEELLRDFPFIDDGGASRAVGVSLLITAVIRAALIVAPIHAARAPAAGTGKSYWYDVAAAIVYGERCPVVFAGKSTEELEKKLNGILLRGTSLFNLDNLNIPLEGDLLCQAAERPLLDLRRLGKSDIFRTPNSALVGACGNNLAVHADLNRRVVIADMDANMERPELRDFKGSNPYRAVLADRGKYIAAALTIVRAYLADPSDVVVTPLASYDDYTKFVREPLVWLGRADPARTMDALAAADPIMNELHTVMNAWQAAIGIDEEITAANTVRNIENPPSPKRDGLSQEEWYAQLTALKARWRDLGDALEAASDRRKGSGLTARQVGAWLRDNRNRIANGKHFMSRTVHGGEQVWWLAEQGPLDC